MKCRCCGGEMHLMETVDGCLFSPGWISRTYEENNKDFRSVTLYECKACSHIQSEYQLDEDFYNKYESLDEGASEYKYAVALAKDHLNRITRYSPSTGLLIEIGCGRGEFLHCAKEVFHQCIGVDPSNNVKYASHDDNVEIINDYFNDDLAFSEEADAIVSFQVFEHLRDLNSVVKCAYRCMKPGGLLYVNVPNGQRIKKEGLYHQVTGEHINYFTPKSLCTVAEQYGFELISIEDDYRYIELNACFRKPEDTEEINQVRMKNKEQLDKFFDRYKSVTVWGAGAKSIIYLSLIDNKEKIAHIIDGDTNKAGKYIYGGGKHSIEHVSKQIVDETDAVLILATSYLDEIIMELKEMGYTKEVAYFEKQLVVRTLLEEGN